MVHISMVLHSEFCYFLYSLGDSSESRSDFRIPHFPHKILIDRAKRRIRGLCSIFYWRFFDKSYIKRFLLNYVPVPKANAANTFCYIGRCCKIYIGHNLICELTFCKLFTFLLKKYSASHLPIAGWFHGNAFGILLKSNVWITEYELNVSRIVC